MLVFYQLGLVLAFMEFVEGFKFAGLLCLLAVATGVWSIFTHVKILRNQQIKHMRVAYSELESQFRRLRISFIVVLTGVPAILQPVFNSVSFFKNLSIEQRLNIDAAIIAPYSFIFAFQLLSFLKQTKKK